MKAMLLAAGLGTRMRPLTETTAKPLLPLGGRSLLDHALDRLRDAGVTEVVVNAWWHADHIAAHLASRTGGPPTVVRREDALLDTGGSVAAALDLLGPDPFLRRQRRYVLARRADACAAAACRRFGTRAADAVLLVYRTFQIAAETGPGDFALDPWGVMRRRQEREIVPYIYAGIQLVSPALFADAPAGSFSMNLLWDQAIARRRLRGVVHDGLWFHLSTPTDLAAAEVDLHAAGDRRVALNLATIPPDAAFLEVLARRWLEHPEPARGFLLLPTRRSARALAEAFLRVTDGRPLLLPRITAFGALDEAPLALAGALDLPPAIEPAHRLAPLSELILRLAGEPGRRAHRRSRLDARGRTRRADGRSRARGDPSARGAAAGGGGGIRRALAGNAEVS